MPLKKSASRKAFKENVKEMMHSPKKHSLKQALAAAYATKEKAEGKGKKKDEDGKHGMTIVISVGNKKSK